MTTGFTFKFYKDHTAGFTYYKPEANFSGNYVELVGHVVRPSGSSGTEAINWSTSGGQITVDASYSGITVEASPLLPYPSGTSGLSAGWVGEMELVSVANAGSEVRARIDGHFEVLQGEARK